MPLESCMILLDNSEFMRNGDYVPTRLGAQHDAANLVVTQKTRSNPESTVGVIAMSGKFNAGVSSDSKSNQHSSDSNVELLVSPTDDMGKILNALHGVPIRGGAGLDASTAHWNHSGVDINASIQVASLALKHRRNKNGQQRIVMFVGSPLTHVDTRSLVKTGKALKKNNVAIDVIAMGELEENENKLKELVDAANGGSSAGDMAGERTCHLVTIPPGVLPSNVLVGSPIIHGGAAESSRTGATEFGGSGQGNFSDFGGVDPNMDPELAMALRISMEEERARQERLARDQNTNQSSANMSGQPAVGGVTSSSTDVDHQGTAMAIDSGVNSISASTSNLPVNNGGGFFDDEMGDEDALLQQALAMSMVESHAPDTTISSAAVASSDTQVQTTENISTHVNNTLQDSEDNEDEAMQMALQMSMQDSEDVLRMNSQGQPFQDPHFVNQLLESLPGVNPNDPLIQSVLETARNTSSSSSSASKGNKDAMEEEEEDAKDSDKKK